MDMQSTEGRLAAARELFDAAIAGCVENGPMPQEILYLWSPQRPDNLYTLVMPPCRTPGMRPSAVKALAKAHKATVAFLVLEVTMELRPVIPTDEGITFGDAAGDPVDALMGVLLTGDGDATYLSVRSSESDMSEVQVKGELVDEPVPSMGNLSNLLRVDQAVGDIYH